jgi:hypothetical protein
VPGEELLRNLYPEVLHLTEAEVHVRAERDPATRAFLLSIYEDLQWARSRSGLRGWVARSNPFLRLDLSAASALRLRSAKFRQSAWTVRANAWFGIGIWILAERYYKRAIHNAVARNDAGVALDTGVRLGLVYLGAGQGLTGLYLARHLQQATDRLSGAYRKRMSGPAVTVLCLALLMTGQYREAEMAGQRLRQVNSGLAVDETIYRLLADTLWATGQAAELERWQESWWDLRRIVVR